MAAMTPELKARFKELGIHNSCWKGPNGKTYTVCRGGEFFMHTICETYVPRRYVFGKQKCEDQGLDPEEMVKYIEYKALRYHSSYGGGGYEKPISYRTVEEFNKLWAMFQMGYKDAEMRNKLNNIKEDF